MFEKADPYLSFEIFDNKINELMNKSLRCQNVKFVKSPSLSVSKRQPILIPVSPAKHHKTVDNVSKHFKTFVNVSEIFIIYFENVNTCNFVPKPHCHG